MIGEFARTPRYQGAGSSQVNPTRVDVAAGRADRGAWPRSTVDFAAGFGMDERPRSDAALADEAVARGRAGADVVVAFLGLPAAAESEGFDRTHMDLPADQLALLRAGSRRRNDRSWWCSPTARPCAPSAWEQHAPRRSWSAGWAGRRPAGRSPTCSPARPNPSGRLAETIPLRLEDTPSYLNFPGESGQVRYGEGVFVGYRGYDAAERTVAYPFGHGLSYTTFAYDDLAVRGHRARSRTATCRHGRAPRSPTPATGAGAGGGPALRRRPEAGGRPTGPRAEGLRQGGAGAGRGRRSRSTWTARDFSYWSSTRARLGAGGRGVRRSQVGASSRDIRLTSHGHRRRARRRGRRSPPRSSLEEWLADPDGERALRAAIGTNADGTPAGILSNPQMQRMLGNFPVSTLAAFAEFGLSHEIVDRLVAERA